MILLEQGDSGPEVRALQQALLSFGYKLPQYGADGIYGPETAAAITQWKKDTGAYPGVVDGSYVTQQGYNSLVGDPAGNGNGEDKPIPDHPRMDATTRKAALALGAAGVLAYLLS
jgi:peptidoglycan hydrolase-like protein with peptidoglycan-binding domain